MERRIIGIIIYSIKRLGHEYILLGKSNIILLIEFFQDISENMFFMSAFLKHMFEIPGYNVS